MGWKLFSHSLGLLFRNWKDAIRISSPIIAVMVIGILLYGNDFVAVSTGDSVQMEIPLGSATLQLVLAICSLWVAVAWHRYVLLEEDDGGMVPPFHGGLMLGYFGRSLLIAIVLFIAAMIAGTLGGVIVAGLPFLAPFFLALTMIGVVLLMWAFYRFSPILPAAAIDKPIKLGEAWEATKPLSGAIIIAGVLFVLLAMVTGMVAGLFALIPLLGPLILGAFNWAYIMIGISILTTVYGVSIEGRSLG